MPLIATKGAASAQGFGEFAQSSEPVYIESCFSTYLYTGDNSVDTTVNNGIDLSGKGGLVWLKARSGSFGTDRHELSDTARGVFKYVSSNSTAAEVSGSSSGAALKTFNSNGFTLKAGQVLNFGGDSYVSWTFRKQAKFFDVVTWTGDGTSGRSLPHSLGSVPGCVIIKPTSTTSDWVVWHRSLSGTYPSSVDYLRLNLTDAAGTASQPFTQAPSSTALTLSASVSANSNGATYVAYLFAHDAGGFGLTGTDNVVSCGSFTTAGSGGKMTAAANIGYEPQWLLVKNIDTAENWVVYDIMREMSNTGYAGLRPNTSGAEFTGTSAIAPNAVGFNTPNASGPFANSSNYIYIAIRRGPMKVPTSGTSVLGLNKYSETSDYQQITTGNLVDLGWQVLNGDGYKFFTRLVGAGYLNPASTAAANTSAATKFDYMDGFAPYYANSVGAFNPREVYGFRRAPGFFDVVCYTFTGATTIFNHNLGVAPELIITKERNKVWDWYSWGTVLGANKYFILNSNAAATSYTFGTAVTTTTFQDAIASSNEPKVAYLFATVAGVSKVGSYTGTGTTLQIDCGFTGGARFVLIKRTDSTGDWYVYDTARGIVSGNDPYLFLNSTAAEVTNTDYVDTYSAGFELSSTAPAALNANGGTFIFLAIA